MDIEGDERKLIIPWARRGLLNNVQQLAFEFHNAYGDNLFIYFDILKELDALGFKIITFDPNLIDAEVKKYHVSFEIVLRKTELPCSN